MSRAFVFLVALGYSSIAIAQPPPRDTSARVTGTASIRGRVTDASGRPLARVEVRAGNSGGQQVNGLTDREGRYDLSDLPGGTYIVTATKANYVGSSWGEQRPEGPGQRITLADGETLGNINFRLARSGVIAGKLVDEFGDPIADALVSAMRYQYVQGSRRLMPSGHRASTDDIGEFRVYGLSPGQYYVSATLPTPAATATDANDRTGYAPTFYPGTGNAAQAQRLTIAPGQTIAGINLTLLPIQTSNVSGTVYGMGGKPIAGGSIVATPKSPMMGIGTMPNPVHADGQFTVKGLPPGEYVLRATTSTGSTGQETALAEVIVTGSDIVGVQLVTAKPSTIRGRVVFTPGAASNGPPRPTAIDLGAVREWVLGQQVRSQATIKEDGTFEISLGAGHVQLRAAPRGGAAGSSPWRLNRVVLNDLDVGDTGIDVPPNGTIENVIVEMTDRSYEVAGRVTDGDGNTVRDCFVIVFAQDPARWTVQTRYVSVSRPGVDDRYRMRLLPGDYYAVAMSDVEPGAWTDRDFLSLARERAKRFSIVDGEKTIDLPLSPAPVF